MGEVIKLVRKKKKNPVTIDGVTYIPGEDFANRVGITVGTLYQWNSEGRIPEQMFMRYLGGIYYEEKAVEPFKISLMEKIKVFR